MDDSDPNTVNVYAHRDRNGYAYVSFGRVPDGVDPTMEQERIESVVFDAHPDDFWGPSPSEVELNPECVDDDYGLPVERDRDLLTLYKVGELQIERSPGSRRSDGTDDEVGELSVKGSPGSRRSSEVVDDPDIQVEATETVDVLSVDASRGDVFTTDDGPICIESTLGGVVTVSDPTVTDPIDNRFGQWELDPIHFVEDVHDGRIERARLEVVAD